MDTTYIVISVIFAVVVLLKFLLFICYSSKCKIVKIWGIEVHREVAVEPVYNMDMLSHNNAKVNMHHPSDEQV